MKRVVMQLQWAPGIGYSLTQGTPPVDLLALAEARLTRAYAGDLAEFRAALHDLENLRALIAELNA